MGRCSKCGEIIRVYPSTYEMLKLISGARGMGKVSDLEAYGASVIKGQVRKQVARFTGKGVN